MTRQRYTLDRARAVAELPALLHEHLGVDGETGLFLSDAFFAAYDDAGGALPEGLPDVTHARYALMAALFTCDPTVETCTIQQARELWNDLWSHLALAWTEYHPNGVPA